LGSGSVWSKRERFADRLSVSSMMSSRRSPINKLLVGIKISRGCTLSAQKRVDVLEFHYGRRLKMKGCCFCFPRNSILGGLLHGSITFE
jgi:hypothetical protein